MAAIYCMTATLANGTAAELGTNSGRNSNCDAPKQEPSPANAQSPQQPIIHGETHPLRRYVEPAGNGGISMVKKKLLNQYISIEFIVTSGDSCFKASSSAWLSYERYLRLVEYSCAEEDKEKKNWGMKQL